MKKEIQTIIEIPTGVEVEIKKDEVIMKSGGKEAKREFHLPKIKLEKKENQIIFSCPKATKRELKLMNTAVAHVRNMIKGFNEAFVYKLEICNVHFPMTAKVEGSELVIKNFLGEKIPRRANLLEGVDVKVSGNIVEVSSHNRELAGQTAANIEISTKLRGRDRRVFQDGIFLTDKPGRKI